MEKWLNGLYEEINNKETELRKNITNQVILPRDGY